MRNLREELRSVCVWLKSVKREKRNTDSLEPSRIRGRSEMAPCQGDSGIMHDVRTPAHGKSHHTYTVDLILLVVSAAYFKRLLVF